MDAPQALALTESRYRSGDLAGAERDCREALRLEPGHAPVWLLLGAVCHRTGRHEEAMPALRASILLDPTGAAAWNVLGTTLAVLGQPDQAEPCFRRALQLRPDHLAALHAEARPRMAASPLCDGPRSPATSSQHSRSPSRRPAQANERRRRAVYFLFLICYTIVGQTEMTGGGTAKRALNEPAAVPIDG